MRLDHTAWNALLQSCLTTPGVSLPPRPMPDLPFDWTTWSTKEWSGRRAFERLGIARLEIPPEMKFKAAGFASRDGIGLNMLTPNKIRTIAHELAHWLMKHAPHPDDAWDRARHMLSIPAEEFQADCVALLVCYTLIGDEAELADCRAYIQEFTVHNQNATVLSSIRPDWLPRSWDEIKMTAQAILAAGMDDDFDEDDDLEPGDDDVDEDETDDGLEDVLRRPPPAPAGPPRRIVPVSDFGKRIRWTK